MLGEGSVKKDLIVYQLKLMALFDRFGNGERSGLYVKAQEAADALDCLMAEVPLNMRPRIDYRFEELRISTS